MPYLDRRKKVENNKKLRLIKKLMPHACIGVDVIVGFPGETEEEFNKKLLLQYMKKGPRKN